MGTTTSTWKGVSGNWTDKADWSDGVPNGGADDAILAGATTAYTVTSSGNVTLDFLNVGDNATLSLTGGTFSMDSTVNPYSVMYVYGSVDVGAGAKLSLGAVPGGDTSEIYGSGTVNVAKGGEILLNSSWNGFFGSKFVLAGGVASADGTQQNWDNDSATISGYGELVSMIEAFGTGGSDTVTFGGTTVTVGTNVILTNAHQGTIDATGAKGDYLLLFTGFANIENDGLLKTTGAGGLVIASSMNQNGTMVAAGAGAITIVNADVNGGGTTTIDAGGSIVLLNGQLETGGEFDIDAKGVLTNSSGDLGAIGSNDNYVGDVLNTTIANSGSIEVAAKSVLNDTAFVFNSSSGVVDLDGSSAGTATLELFDGGATFDGGKIVLSATGQNLIDSNGAGAQFSNNADLTGAGSIGDGWLRLYNGVLGVIDADVAAGLTIVTDAMAVANNSENTDYNAGLIETTGAGVLTIEGGLFGNGGTIDAAGGAITLDGLDDNTGGGVLETTGSGKIVLEKGVFIEHNDFISIAAGGTLTTTKGDNGGDADTVLEGIYWNGAVDVVADSTFITEGHWQGAGEIDLGAAGKGGGATIDVAGGDSWSLLGGGTLHLLNADDVIAAAGGGAQLRFRGMTVVGAGTLGDDNMAVGIQGGSTVDATGVMKIDATNNLQNTQLYNNALLEATGGGSLTLEAATFNSGEILVATKSSFIAENVVYGSGGEVEIQGSGVATFKSELDNDVIFGAAGGTLNLGSANQFYGSIYGFAAGDTIDLEGFALKAGSTPVLNFGTLAGFISLQGTIGSATITEQLNFLGDYANDSKLWSIKSDGAGGTKITL